MGKNKSSKGATDPLKLSAIEKQFVKKLQEKAGEEPFTPSLATWNSICGFKRVKDVIKILDKLVGLGKLYKNKKKYSFSEIHGGSSDQDDIYTDEYRKELSEEISRYNRFVVTTAVSGKEVNSKFVASIKNYAKRHNALPLVFPCEDIASRGKKAKAIDLDPELKDFKVIFKDTYLNSNLCLCAIKVSAKQINSLTGLDRLATQREASIIVGATKQFLHYIPTLQHKTPLAALTTGAVTANNYDNDKWMCKRISTIAENDHMYGAVIIEIRNNKFFDFRQVEAASDGSFVDLNIKYNPDGTTTKMTETVLILGDSHTGYHDKGVFDASMRLADEVRASEIILHDTFNGTSISHHDKGKDLDRARKAKMGLLSLETECIAVGEYLKLVSKHALDRVVIVPSNHDSHLERYLQESRYISDPINLEFSLNLAKEVINERDPLKYAVEEELGYKNIKVKWLAKGENYLKYGVELGSHGHQGANGAKGSIAAFERGLGNCVTAHTHTACKVRKACSVGTSSSFNMGYNTGGLSNWTHTCCLLYRDGTKQLVNFIQEDGVYKYKRETE